MKRALVPLAEGFEEIETATVVDVLRRAEVEVVLAGIDGGGPVLGSRGMRFVADTALADCEGSWDLVVLPGGGGGAERLAECEALLDLLREQHGAGRMVAAICAAPFALDRAGVLSEGSFTCYPGWEDHLGSGGRRSERVVDASSVVTSQGPGTAMEFALHLVARLAGEARRQEVARAMLFER